MELKINEFFYVLQTILSNKEQERLSKKKI